MSGSSQKVIRFRFAPEKAKEAILWMLSHATASLDLHTILKTCYFADRASINACRRPVFGARYRAMKFGPVPLEIYEMLKGEPLWLAELGLKTFPWALDGFVVRATTNEHENRDVFSLIDLECLQDGFAKASSLTFDARTAATHGADWQKANLGPMTYEDMLEETDDKRETIDYLRESAAFMRF